MKIKLLKSTIQNYNGEKVKFPIHHGFSNLSKILYLYMAFVGFSVYVLQRFEIPLPWLINNYLNDLLCMPLVLGALTFIIRWLKKDLFFKFPLFFVLFMAGYYSFYFEYYLPKVNVRYTSDWMDVFLYFIGSVGFYYFQKKEAVVPIANSAKAR